MNLMYDYTAHVDTFARDRLPPRELWPEFRFDLPELDYPARTNCARVLLDDALSEGCAARIALRGEDGEWSYARLAEQTNRLANVLVQDLGIVPGNRVLLRGAQYAHAGLRVARSRQSRRHRCHDDANAAIEGAGRNRRARPHRSCALPGRSDRRVANGGIRRRAALHSILGRR